jgi:hypothetical protein
MLVDGHLRHAALLDLGTREAPCLITDDDEAFTYNKRVNRLATIQEHYMIVKAIERGVSGALRRCGRWHSYPEWEGSTPKWPSARVRQTGGPSLIPLLPGTGAYGSGRDAA